MKILHLNDHLSWSGGVETYLLSLVPQLASLGHDQTVGFATGDAELVAGSRRLPFLSRADRAARRAGFKQTTELLIEERPDIVHVHNIHNTGALEACLRRVPTILHGHDYRYLCPASSFYFRRKEAICNRTCGPMCFAATVRGRCMSLRPPYAWTYYRRVRFVASNATQFSLVIANSRYMADRFTQAGFDPERVAVLPYFCPIDPVAQPHVPPASPTILFIGRARANKGYRYFVEALGLLPQCVRGIMVGDFSEDASAEVRRLAAIHGCDGRLQIRPWASRDSVRELYSHATVTVVPSVWAEPLGIVGLESLACGVPVVASDVGGVREWLIDGRTGRLASAKSAAAIARAAREILDSSDQGSTLGEGGRKLIEERFSTAGHVEKLLSYYRSACRTQPARGSEACSMASGAV